MKIYTNRVQGKHPSSSSLLPALTVLKSESSNTDEFGQRAIALSFFLHTPFPPLEGLLKVQYIFWSPSMVRTQN